MAFLLLDARIAGSVQDTVCVGVRACDVYTVVANTLKGPATVTLSNGEVYECKETFGYIMTLLESSETET